MVVHINTWSATARLCANKPLVGSLYGHGALSFQRADFPLTRKIRVREITSIQSNV